MRKGILGACDGEGGGEERGGGLCTPSRAREERGGRGVTRKSASRPHLARALEDFAFQDPIVLYSELRPIGYTPRWNLACSDWRSKNRTNVDGLEFPARIALMHVHINFGCRSAEREDRFVFA